MDAEEVRRRWADRTTSYSPRYYAHHGPNEASERVRERLDAVVEPDAAVLELGCSSGRHLAHLREHGYEDLHGVEINDDALAVMAEAYPGLAATGTFYLDAIESVVPSFEDGRFDAVYSVETLQHLHPGAHRPLDHLSRIANDRLITVENEGGDGAHGGRNGEPSAVEEPSSGGTPAEQPSAGETPAGQPSAGETPAGQPSSDGPADVRPPTDRSPGERPPDEFDVAYVDDGIPLYKRDWRRIFAARGFDELHAESLARTTLREFRPAGR